MTDRTGHMGNTFPFSGEAWMLRKECSVMDERRRFVARLPDGEAMSEVCRAFGISPGGERHNRFCSSCWFDSALGFRNADDLPASPSATAPIVRNVNVSLRASVPKGGPPRSSIKRLI